MLATNFDIDKSILKGRRLIAFFLFFEGDNTNDVAKELKISIGEAKQYRDDYLTKQNLSDFFSSIRSLSLFEEMSKEISRIGESARLVEFLLRVSNFRKSGDFKFFPKTKNIQIAETSFENYLKSSLALFSEEVLGLEKEIEQVSYQLKIDPERLVDLADLKRKLEKEKRELIELRKKMMNWLFDKLAEQYNELLEKTDETNRDESIAEECNQIMFFEIK